MLQRVLRIRMFFEVRIWIRFFLSDPGKLSLDQLPCIYLSRYPLHILLIASKKWYQVEIKSDPGCLLKVGSRSGSAQSGSTSLVLATCTRPLHSLKFEYQILTSEFTLLTSWYINSNFNLAFKEKKFCTSIYEVWLQIIVYILSLRVWRVKMCVTCSILLFDMSTMVVAKKSQSIQSNAFKSLNTPNWDIFWAFHILPQICTASA